MAEVILDEFSLRYRLYVRWIVRRICSSILDKARLEKLAQDVLIIMARKARDFSSSDLDSRKKLSRRVCAWLNETLCALLSDEFSEKDLFRLIARKHLSSTAMAAANKAHNEIYRLHFVGVTRACRYFSRGILSNGEVEELVQEVFLIAYQKAHQFQADKNNVRNSEKLHSHVHAWLSAIAYHRVMDQCRRRDRAKLTMINPEDLPTKDLDGMIAGEGLEGALSPEGEFELEVSKLIEMIAARILSARDLDVFLTERDFYGSEEERERARRELEIRRKITSNHRSKIYSRCIEKITKYLWTVAQRLFSEQDLKIFISITRLYSEDKSMENAWRELESTHCLTRAELRELYELGSKKMKRYLETHRDE